MKSISTALLSFGMSGKLFQAPFLDAHPGFSLTVVWERTQAIAGEYYPAIRSVSSIQEILNDPEIELVVVNTPTATHFDYAKQVLLAGKHAVVEKAFTTTVAEAIELKNIATEKKRCLSVFQNRRWDSDFLTVRRIIQSGVMGEILEAELHYDRYKEALSPKMHKETPILGAGVVYDLGPHLIDEALMLFGFPEAVFADIRATRNGSKVDDYFEILLYYPTLRVSGSFHKSRADVQEAALLANVPVNSPNWGLEPESESGLLHTEINGKIIREHVPTEKGDYGQYYEGIFQHIRNGAPLQVTADDGIRVMRVITSALLSSAEKRVIHFN